MSRAIKWEKNDLLVAQSYDSLLSHRLQPGRLLCPWDSPGKTKPGIEPWSPTLQTESLPSEPAGKPQAL